MASLSICLSIVSSGAPVDQTPVVPANAITDESGNAITDESGNAITDGS